MTPMTDPTQTDRPNCDPRRKIARVQTGVRIEARVLKVLKGLAAHHEIGLGDLIEGMALHAFEGRVPFGAESRGVIDHLRAAYGLDLTAADSHLLVEGEAPAAADPAAPVAITRRAGFTLPYPPQQAIRLFSAEGEKLWLGEKGWNPDIRRGDGFSPGNVFVQGETVFVTAAFDPARGVARYARVRHGHTAGMVDVRVAAEGQGARVSVSYAMTGLGAEGNDALASTTEAAFAEEIAGWAAAIAANHAAIASWLAARRA